MTDELDNLRPEVREAINRTDMTVEMFDTLVTVNRDDYDIIHAELLRLAGECAMVPRAQLLANFAAANERAEKAEAEIAALKTRIAGSPACGVFTDAKVYCCVPRDWVGMRVRLVVEK